MKNKNSNQSGRKERMECSADTKLFFDDVYKLGTREKKQQVETIQSERSILSKCARYTQYFLSDVYINSTRTKKAQVETAQCGRSMIEMLGVLAIVGVLSVGGIAGYSKAMEQFKINKMMSGISHIITNIRTLYASQSLYNGWTEDYIKAGVVPEEFETNTYYVFNVWGGDSWIFPSNEGKSIVFSTRSLPKEACIKIATQDWGSSSTSGFSGIIIGKGYYSYSNELMTDNCGTGTARSGNGGDIYYACPPNTPISVATAAQYCNCQDDNECMVALQFKK